MKQTLSAVGKRLVGLVGILSLSVWAAFPVLADNPASKAAKAPDAIAEKGTHGGAAAAPAAAKPTDAVTNKGSGGDGGIANNL